MSALYFGVTPLILASSGTAIGASSSTSEVNFKVITVPANLLGANGGIRVDALFKYTGTANTKRVTMRFSGTSGDVATGFAFHNFTDVATALSESIVGKAFWNSNATNAQITFDATARTFGQSTTTVTTGAIDTTAVSYININGLVANAGDSIQLLSYTIWFIPGV